MVVVTRPGSGSDALQLYTNQLRQAGLPGKDDIENGLQGITQDQTHLYIYSDFDIWHIQ